MQQGVIICSQKLTELEQLWAPMYEGSATAAQKPKMTLSASRDTSTMAMLNLSMKEVGRKYSKVRSHHTPTNRE